MVLLQFPEGSTGKISRH